MITLIKDYFKAREQRRVSRAFVEEVKHNLEQYYVMFQINRLRFFALDEWQRFSALTSNVPGPAVAEYARRLTVYNQTLKEYKEFEQWYNEDLDRKNQDNGRVLHQKKEMAQAQFKGLESVIKAALEEAPKFASRI